MLAVSALFAAALIAFGVVALGCPPVESLRDYRPPQASRVLDRDGNLWVADYGRDRVVKLAPDGHLLLSWGNRGSGPGEFVGPKGVAIDPATGHVYVADTGNGRIQRLAPDGTPELSWPMPPVAGSAAP